MREYINENQKFHSFLLEMNKEIKHSHSSIQEEIL